MYYITREFINIIKIKNFKSFKNLKKKIWLKILCFNLFWERIKFSLQNKLFTYIQIPVNLADSYLFFKYQKNLKIKK